VNAYEKSSENILILHDIPGDFPIPADYDYRRDNKEGPWYEQLPKLFWVGLLANHLSCSYSCCRYYKVFHRSISLGHRVYII